MRQVDKPWDIDLTNLVYLCGLALTPETDSEGCVCVCVCMRVSVYVQRFLLVIIRGGYEDGRTWGVLYRNADKEGHVSPLPES